MPRARLTLQEQRDGPGADPGVGARRIHLFDGWMEEHVDASGLQHPAIDIEGPGIAGQVLAGGELQRVDEDAGDDAAARTPSRLNQAQVAGMQRSHGGDEADPAPLLVPAARDLLQLADRLDDPHLAARTTLTGFAAGAIRAAP
jgi:hypothetical protein